MSRTSLDMGDGSGVLYWSQRAMNEDKKRCLAPVPIVDKTAANTLEHLHEDKKHHSNAANAEERKTHRAVGDRQKTLHRPSTPIHPYAEEKSLHWSQKELAESKRRMKTDMSFKAEFERAGPREPASARERQRVKPGGSISGSQTARSPGSVSGSVASKRSDRTASEADSRLSRGASGAQSPTIKELIHPHRVSRGGRVEEHPHNTTAENWWGVIREDKDPTQTHKSFVEFETRKKHHATELHQPLDTRTPRTAYGQTFPPGGFGEDGAPKVKMLYQRDPLGCAVQGDFPRAHRTNEAWGERQGDPEAPHARYGSCALMALDKRRHATPLDGGMKKEVNRLVSQEDMHLWGSPPPGKPQATEQQSNEEAFQTKGGKKMYQSNFTMNQHKKKHLAEVNGTGLRAGMQSTTHGEFSTKGKTPIATPDAKGNNFTSQKELQYCKRFNTVTLKTSQDIDEGELAERPWPKPGGGLVDGRHPPSDTSSTPAYPANSPQDPQTASRRAHHFKAVQKYSEKSGVRNSVDSSASDPYLLHSSHNALAERKVTHATSMRHSPRKKQGDRTRGPESYGGSSSCSDILRPAREPAPDGGTLRSQKQLEYCKTLHKFGHDDTRRQKAVPTPCPVAPTPRSGQWTPAHI